MKLLKKLRSRRGESLAETLCAVLVAGLAVSLLAGMVSAATRIASKANTIAYSLYAAVSDAETRTGTEASGTVTVTVKKGETVNTASPSVTLYGVADEVLSYKATDMTGGGGS